MPKTPTRQLLLSLFSICFFLQTAHANPSVKEDSFTNLSFDQLDSLMLIAYAQGDLAGCIRYMQTGKKKAQTELGKEDSVYASYVGNLGYFYTLTGDYLTAEPLCIEAVKVIKLAMGRNSSRYAGSINNLAILYGYMGNYTQAELLYLEAMHIMSSIKANTHPDYGMTLSSLGGLYVMNKRFNEAEPLLLEARAVFATSIGKQNASYTLALNNLASLYLESAQYDKALPIYLESNAILAEVRGIHHPDYAVGISNLGDLYRKMGKMQEARSLKQEACDIFLKAYGKEDPRYAASLTNMALFYIDIDSLDKAYVLCQQALDANSPQINSNFSAFENLDQYDYYSYREVYATLNTLLNIQRAQYHDLKERDYAERQFIIAEATMRLNERVRNNFTSDENKLRVLQKNHRIARKGIEAAVVLQTEQAIKAAFHFAEQNKSTLVSDAVKSEKARSFGDLPQHLAQQETLLQTQLNAIKKQQYDAATSVQQEAITQQLSDINFKIDTFLNSLKNQYPQYHQLKYANVTAKAEDIQALLDDNTLLIEYFQADNVLYIFAVNSTSVKIYPIPINQQEFKSKIKLLREVLDTKFLFEHSKTESYLQYTENASWIFTKVLSPALQNNNIKNLIIIPDGDLVYLPFETLLTEPPAQALTSYKSLPYLIKDYNISYSYAATIWKENLASSAPSHNSSMLACAASYPAIDSSLLNVRLPHYYRLRSSLFPLLAVAKEVAALDDNFQGDFYYGKDVNEKNFKNIATNYGIIHLAMHGVVDTLFPSMSALAFTEDLDSTEDNFLHAYEISGLKLSAQLVVLSACKTGLGKYDQTDGIMSLARSFMFAGVPSLVVSLRQVNDAVTADLMKGFYQYLSTGKRKSAALKQAKLDYIEQVDELMAHPAFWSPFIQLGDDSPIEIATKNRWYWWLAGGIMAVLIGMLVWRTRLTKKT